MCVVFLSVPSSSQEPSTNNRARDETPTQNIMRVVHDRELPPDLVGAYRFGVTEKVINDR